MITGSLMCAPRSGTWYRSASILLPLSTEAHPHTTHAHATGPAPQLLLSYTTCDLIWLPACYWWHHVDRHPVSLSHLGQHRHTARGPPRANCLQQYAQHAATHRHWEAAPCRLALPPPPQAAQITAPDRRRRRGPPAPAQLGPARQAPGVARIGGGAIGMGAGEAGAAGAGGGVSVAASVARGGGGGPRAAPKNSTPGRRGHAAGPTRVCARPPY